MYLIYVYLSVLPGHTSLPSNQPDHLKVKKGAYDGKFLKENQVFHHTFCIIMRLIMMLEYFWLTSYL